MMNKVLLIGRLIKDVEVKKTQSGKSVAEFILAIDRLKKPDEEKAKADFPRCVCYGRTADFLGQYGKKGNTVAVVGRWQTGNYERDGVKVYTNDCYCEDVQMITKAKKENTNDVVEIMNNTYDFDDENNWGF